MSDAIATLEARGLSVRIDGRTILKRLTTGQLQQGHIFGIVGQNGGGKTTLLRILSGFFPERANVSGKVFINREDILPLCTSLAQARAVFRKASVHLVSQESPIISELSVLENIFLGQGQDAWFRRPNKSLRENSVGGKLAALGWHLRLDHRGMDCTPAERQKVAIIRALLKDPPPHFILFDEPTTHLSAEEVTALYKAIRTLAASGIGIILVSHKPTDIINSCDSVLLLHAGSIISQWTGHISLQNMSEYFGNAAVFPRLTAAPGKLVLKLSIRVLADELGRVVLRDFGPLALCSGEVVGIVSSHTNMTSSIFDLLCGIVSPQRFNGSIEVLGQPLQNGTSVREQLSVGIISDNKLARGLIADMTLQENLILGRSDIGSWIWSPRAERAAFSSAGRMNLHSYKLTDPLRTLSGGYQQRALLARELDPNAQLIIMHNPSHGLDISTRDRMCEQVRHLAQRGTAVLLLTSDLEEAKSLATRHLIL